MNFHQVPVWEFKVQRVRVSPAGTTVSLTTTEHSFFLTKGPDGWVGVCTRHKSYEGNQVYLPKEFTRQLVVWLTMEGKL